MWWSGVCLGVLGCSVVQWGCPTPDSERPQCAKNKSAAPQQLAGRVRRQLDSCRASRGGPGWAGGAGGALQLDRCWRTARTKPVRWMGVCCGERTHITAEFCWLWTRSKYRAMPCAALRCAASRLAAASARRVCVKYLRGTLAVPRHAVPRRQTRRDARRCCSTSRIEFPLTISISRHPVSRI